MLLPSRLRETTLGDLLATLHRAYASGVLELVEPHRRHTVHLRRGLVQAVECSERAHRFGDLAADTGLCARSDVERASREARARGWRIGHHLVTTGAMTAHARDRVLDAQRARRLDALYAVSDADLRFHAARPLPPGSAEQTPMEAREAFFGRARRRDRGRATQPAHREAALATLGLTADATDAQVRARYRDRVRALHPDSAPSASEAERARQVSELRAVIEAYRVLTRPRA